MNYNHLYYFWTIAKEENISRAAEKLHVSQPSLSLQLKKLEEFFQVKLFERQNKKLILTREGKEIYPLVDEIFQAGSLIERRLLKSNTLSLKKKLRIGTVSTLSKNLQYFFLRPLLTQKEIQTDIKSGSLEDLTLMLNGLNLDMIISNTPPPVDTSNYMIKKLYDFPCVIVGNKKFLDKKRTVKETLESVPVYLPTENSQLRNDIEAYFYENKIKPNIISEVDDTALLRLFAISGEGVAIISKIGIIRDIEDKQFSILHYLPELSEAFYIVTKRTIFEEFKLSNLIDNFQINF